MGFELVMLQYRCDAPTNWAMKPLVLGAGHLWVVGPKGPVRNECEVIIWNISYIELWMCTQVSYETRSYESNLCNCVYRKPWKSQDFKGCLNVWSRDTGVTLQPADAMKPLMLGAGHWRVVGPKEPMRNECEVIIWNISYIELRMWNQVSYDPCSYESN